MSRTTNRAITRVEAIKILDAASAGQPLPCKHLYTTEATMSLANCDAVDIDELEGLLVRLSSEVVAMADELDFCGEFANQLVHIFTSTPELRGLIRDENITRLAEICNAGHQHELPEWWPAFRDARNRRSKHG